MRVIIASLTDKSAAKLTAVHLPGTSAEGTQTNYLGHASSLP